MDPSALGSPELQDFINHSIYCLLRENCDRLNARYQEQQKAMVNEMIGKLTSACWDKCITGTPGSKFSSSEQTCLTNCAQRYMDMSLLIMKRLQQ